MTTQYTDLELDALREVSNIGSGNAATSLSSLLGRPVDVSVPAVYALPLAEAVETIGRPDEEVTAVLVPVRGELETVVLLLFPERDSALICDLLGVDAATELGLSALGEVGNILAASYLRALMSLTGFALEPAPPLTVVDMLGAVVNSVLALGAGEGDTALLLDSELEIEQLDTRFAFLFLLRPGDEGVDKLLAALGLAA